jgi:hypothetical protein
MSLLTSPHPPKLSCHPTSLLTNQPPPQPPTAAPRFIVECLTDNVNRSASDVKAAMTKGGAKPADPGSVMFNFQRQGVVGGWAGGGG